MFYGWQNMLVGEACFGGALAIVVAGVKEGGLLAIGYVVGPPVIHALHDEGTKAWISLGIHLGLPLVGALGGLAVGRALGAETDVRAAVGAMVGLATAPILDGVALGWTREPVEEDEQAGASWLIVPRIDRNGSPNGLDLALPF